MQNWLKLKTERVCSAMKIRSIIAGILIGIGAYAYVSISNKVLGAFLFSIGLISVFSLQAHLFTGKIGGLNKKN